MEERHHHRGRFALATERGTFGSQFQIPIAVGLELAGGASVRFLAVSPSAYRRGKHCSRGGDVAQDALFPRPRWSWASRLGLACTQHTTLLHPLEVIFVFPPSHRLKCVCTGVIRLDLVTFGGLRLTGRSPRVHSLIVHKTFSTPNPVLSRAHSLLCQQPSSVCYQGLITLEERHHHRGRFAFRVDENSVTGGGPVTDR